MLHFGSKQTSKVKPKGFSTSQVTCLSPASQFWLPTLERKLTNLLSLKFSEIFDWFVLFLICIWHCLSFNCFSTWLCDAGDLVPISVLIPFPTPQFLWLSPKYSPKASCLYSFPSLWQGPWPHVILDTDDANGLPSWVSAPVFLWVLSLYVLLSAWTCLSETSFSSFWPLRVACGILVPWPEITPAPLALEVWDFNHWATKKAPIWLFPRHLKTSNLVCSKTK